MDGWPSLENFKFVSGIFNALGLEKGQLGVHAYNWDYLGFNGPENVSDHTILT